MTRIYNLVLTKKNRVTLPESMRNELALMSGDKVEFRISEQRVVMQKQKITSSQNEENTKLV